MYLNFIIINIMSIIYSTIVRSNDGDLTTLCDQDLAHGNYPTICLDILRKAKITQSIIYNYNGDYKFYIIKDEAVLYVCMAVSSLRSKVAFAFLQDIKKKFKEKYTTQQIMKAKDYNMGVGFSETLKNQMNYYNSSQFQDNKDILVRELNNLQEQMTQNIEKVLQNQQKVELIVKRTQKVHTIADEIKKNATKMKKDAFWRRNKCKLAIGGLVTVACASLIFII